jgi:hypothetical protein
MKIGRLLKLNETCDHKNENFTDDSYENLQVLTRRENIQKESNNRGWRNSRRTGLKSRW